MWRETRAQTHAHANADNTARPKILRGAIISILVADVSMSLDNVLAVAGAAHGDPGMLIFGLALSIVLMAVAVPGTTAARGRWLDIAREGPLASVLNAGTQHAREATSESERGSCS